VSRPRLVSGTQIDGRYIIIRAIGSGAMGTVYLAQHSLIGRRVAIKFLHPYLSDNPGVVDLFMREARAAGTLGHPNIVESTDMGLGDDHGPYIVLEYLEGSLLTDEIHKTRQFSPHRVVRIAEQIAAALEVAHASRILHRDLKSDNVFLIERDGISDHVKVLDFGISKLMTKDLCDATGGRTMGTPEYMSPEQIKTPDQVDERMDVYALGVTMYQMLTGATPFHIAGKVGVSRSFYGGETSSTPFHVDGKTTVVEAIDSSEMTDLLRRIVHEPVRPLGPSDAPAPLAALVMSMLEKSPDDRPRTMIEVINRLEQLKPEIGVPEDAPIPVRASTSKIILARAGSVGDGDHRAPERPPPDRWRGWRFVGVGALLLIGIGVAAVVRSNEPAPSAPDQAPAPLAALPAPSAPPAPSTLAVPRSPGPAEVIIVNPGDAAVGESKPLAGAEPKVIAKADSRPATRIGKPVEPGSDPKLDPQSSNRAPEQATPPDAAIDPHSPDPEVVRRPDPPPVETRPVVPPNAGVVASAPKPGYLDPRSVRTAVNSQIAAVQECFERGRMDDPRLAGRVVVLISIAASGSVTATRIESSTLHAPGVEHCIASTVKGWTFPRPAGDVGTTVAYPFALK